MLIKIATFGPCGYIKGSGTLATLITLCFIYGCARIDISQGAYLLILASVLAIAKKAIRVTLLYKRQKDPSEVVLDECVGTLVIFVCRVVSWQSLIIGGVLFRLLDITKPLGIKKVEAWQGEWGVLADDIVAGILTNLLLWLVGY